MEELSIKQIDEEVVLSEEQIVDEEILSDEELVKDLNCFYKYVYPCEKCSRQYGSDKEEKDKHRCPICEGKKV
jgi:DNA-directed RNA polymerase subunit RPC12/RpoP